MILESIVTTVSKNGLVNIAPMGPVVAGGIESPSFLLRPFNSSRTFANLIETRRAVIHVTDDAYLFAVSAVSSFDESTVRKMVRPIHDRGWWVLKECHRWFAVEIESTSDTKPRVDMNCRIVDSATEQPFFGFNRAKHAVIEAAILATRTHILPKEEVDAELKRLRPLIEKTAGGREREGFELLHQAIHERYTSR